MGWKSLRTTPSETKGMPVATASRSEAWVGPTRPNPSQAASADAAGSSPQDIRQTLTVIHEPVSRQSQRRFMRK
eukprot:3868572-Pleurochrysis_carterae.AAC.1